MSLVVVELDLKCKSINHTHRRLLLACYAFEQAAISRREGEGTSMSAFLLESDITDPVGLLNVGTP